MLELHAFDLEQIGSALSDQYDGEHCWLVDPGSGELILWTSDTGVDGQNPVELDELDHLIAIDPLPSHVWYQDMADFVARVSDEQAAERLSVAIQGRGAFRRFKDELYQRHPALIADWHAFRDARAQQRAVDWLVEHELVRPSES